MSDSSKRSTPVKRIYDWFVRWADKPQAERALAGFSFAEATFFPVPPDPLLIAMVFAKPQHYLRLPTITTVFSLAGGGVGYLIGVGLFETVGQWLMDTYHLHDEYAQLGQRFADNAFLVVLTAAFTPIPYKIITIASGAFRVNFAVFFAASIIGRGLRFYGVSYLARYLGAKHRNKIERYIDLISFALVLLLALVFILTR